ncbi:hypothetical protein [Sphingobacterium faecale]|uniref:Uncharacterized protein n=1 Tax=Sphingobacterium faecale TaxID=2803775 RepID=A0ABS1RAG1_9SPHI|nr:hypothetical protein [Sphingobacterium faecale]MBL1411219.1 hypothetical protein [Sphingobacterium faecale]
MDCHGSWGMFGFSSDFIAGERAFNQDQRLSLSEPRSKGQHDYIVLSSWYPNADGSATTVDGVSARMMVVDLNYKHFLGGMLGFVEKHFNGNIGIIGFAGEAYSKIPNSTKYRLVYELSKVTKWKAGEIFQKGKSFSNGVGKFASKAGVAGAMLTAGLIGYELWYRYLGCTYLC